MRDPLVWSADDPECFDFDTLLPDALPGGQSIYGGYFDVSLPSSSNHTSSRTRPPRSHLPSLTNVLQHSTLHNTPCRVLLLMPCRAGLALNSLTQHIARWELPQKPFSERRAVLMSEQIPNLLHIVLYRIFGAQAASFPLLVMTPAGAPVRSNAPTGREL